jgi:NAD(P)-dependent dehydrogenase (short-subunit alcohol dehydrogenase family)
MQKTALVTGAGSGIGRAVALAMQSVGYSVVAAGRRPAELEKTAAAASSSGRQILPVPTDVSKPDSVREKLEARARKYTSPYSEVIRAKVVLFAAQGLSNDVIATRLDTPRQIVSKWRKRFALMRLPGLEEQPRGGRPALFSPQRRRSSKGPRL